MSEWLEVKLGDIALINPTEKLSKGQVATKIGMEHLQPFTKKPTGQAQEKFNGGMKFRNGDTLVARITPCLENGKTAYIDTLKDDEVGFGSTEYIVLREIPKLSDRQFLYYFSRSNVFRDVAIASMTGSSGRQRVQTDVVVNHSFEIPPLSEQQAIASVLSSLDDKIDLLHRQNKTLETMAETLFRQWFIEEAKDDWEEYKVSDIAEHIKLNINPSKSPNHKFIHFSLPAFDNVLRPTRELGSEILSNKYVVAENSILVSKLNPIVSRIWLILESEDNFVCSTEFQNLKPKNKNHLSFLYCLFSSHDVRENLAMSASGTSGSHQRIKPSDMLNVTFFAKDKDYIAVFSKQVEPFFHKKIANLKQIQTLENLRDTLLPKLMRGEVRVQH